MSHPSIQAMVKTQLALASPPPGEPCHSLTVRNRRAGWVGR